MRFLFSPFHFPTNISFWELKTDRISYGIKMMATKNMSRTTRFSILVVLRLPTFDSNFATLLGQYVPCLKLSFYSLVCPLTSQKDRVISQSLSFDETFYNLSSNRVTRECYTKGEPLRLRQVWQLIVSRELNCPNLPFKIVCSFIIHYVINRLANVITPHLIWRCFFERILVRNFVWFHI